MLYDFMQSDHFDKEANRVYGEWTQFSVNEKKLRDLQEQNDEMAK